MNSRNKLTFWQLRRVRDRLGQKCKHWQVRGNYQLGLTEKEPVRTTNASMQARSTHVLLRIRERQVRTAKETEHTKDTHSLQSAERKTNQQRKRKTAGEGYSPSVKQRWKSKLESQDKKQHYKGHSLSVEHREAQVRMAKEIHQAGVTHVLPNNAD